MTTDRTVTEKDLWWLLDAANSIVGPSGNTEHQKRLISLYCKLSGEGEPVQRQGDLFDNIPGEYYEAAIEQARCCFAGEENPNEDEQVDIQEAIWRGLNMQQLARSEKFTQALHYIWNLPPPPPGFYADGCGPSNYFNKTAQELMKEYQVYWPGESWVFVLEDGRRGVLNEYGDYFFVRDSERADV